MGGGAETENAKYFSNLSLPHVVLPQASSKAQKARKGRLQKQELCKEVPILLQQLWNQEGPNAKQGGEFVILSLPSFFWQSVMYSIFCFRMLQGPRCRYQQRLPERLGYRGKTESVQY